MADPDETLATLVRKDHKLVDKRDPLTSVLGWARGDTPTFPVVMDGDEPFGVVNRRALMELRLDERAKVGAYTVAMRPLARTATVAEARRRMGERRLLEAPVHDEGRIVGYVAAVDLLPTEDWRRASEACVPVTTLTEASTVGAVLHAFRAEYVDALPVVDEDRRLVGVVPRRAVLALGIRTGHGRGRKDAGGERPDTLDTPIGSLVEPAPARLRGNAPVTDVLGPVRREGYAVLVDADDALVGMVTPETLLGQG